MIAKSKQRDNKCDQPRAMRLLPISGTYIPVLGAYHHPWPRRPSIGNSRIARGFTLLEILIALFIFAILSLLLSSALHNVIGIQSRTEDNADRLHETQLALLMVSRDVTQAINRPVFTASGKEEGGFVGKPNGFTFTHAGVSNADGKVLRSTLQRIRYFIDGTTLWRNAWAALDQAPQSAPTRRALLTNIEKANFEYLDSKKVFHPEWPPQGGPRELLPRAVKMTLVISKWGKLSQLYVIPAEPTNAATQPPKPKQGAEPGQQAPSTQGSRQAPAPAQQ